MLCFQMLWEGLGKIVIPGDGEDVQTERKSQLS